MVIYRLMIWAPNIPSASGGRGSGGGGVLANEATPHPNPLPDVTPPNPL
jgi:hypothetical protein